MGPGFGGSVLLPSAGGIVIFGTVGVAAGVAAEVAGAKLTVGSLSIVSTFGMLVGISTGFGAATGIVTWFETGAAGAGVATVTGMAGATAGVVTGATGTAGAIAGVGLVA